MSDNSISELELIEQFLIDEGHGVIGDDAPEWARRLDQACEIVRNRWGSLVITEPDDDWGDPDDKILLLEQDRDELASRAAAAQAQHAAALAEAAADIRSHLDWPNPAESRDRLLRLAAVLESKAGTP